MINPRMIAEGNDTIDIDHIPLDDRPSFKLLKTAETTAVFQLESRGMKDLIRRLQPDNLEDMIALVALFRPGPLESGMVDDFCSWANNQLNKVKTTEEIFNLAADAHYKLVSIHPFIDGNGRTSRAIMNYMQLRFTKPLIILSQDNRFEYYKALQRTRKEEDISIIRTFIMDEHTPNLEHEIEKVKDPNGVKDIFLDL
ncbi:MAG: Fic family protein [Flavobacteriales bacterium]|nr:Fic family protein [Flavobacteriales bacterium]